MNAEDLTVKQIREMAAMINGETPQPKIHSHYPIGKNVIVRTVTMVYTGKLESVTDTDLILVDCSWIPGTLAQNTFYTWRLLMRLVAEGRLKECEPYPDGLQVFVNRGALLDMCELKRERLLSQN